MELISTDPPYLSVFTGTSAELRADIDRSMPKSEGKLIVRFLDGRKMKNWPDAMLEIEAKLEFPAYFGRNFAALDECLGDMEWLPADAYLIVVEYASVVLRDEPGDEAVLLFQLFDRVGREWAEGTLLGANWERKPTPFHTILHGK